MNVLQVIIVADYGLTPKVVTHALKCLLVTENLTTEQRVIGIQSANNRKKVTTMSDPTRTPEEYIQRHANQYCNGDTSAAVNHAIVKEVIKEKEKE